MLWFPDSLPNGEVEEGEEGQEEGVCEQDKEATDGEDSCDKEQASLS